MPAPPRLCLPRSGCGGGGRGCRRAFGAVARAAAKTAGYRRKDRRGAPGNTVLELLIL
jgi:hypothetical protein